LLKKKKESRGRAKKRKMLPKHTTKIGRPGSWGVEKREGAKMVAGDQTTDEAAKVRGEEGAKVGRRFAG
jgi:hypothetical protein